MVRALKSTLSSLLIIASLDLSVSASEPLPPRDPSPLTVRQLHSGHSLTDAYIAQPWPGRLVLATAVRTGDRAYQTIQRSIIPGSPLFWRWENSSGYPDARQNIDEFELLVITEGVPLVRDNFEEFTLEPLNRWVAHAWQNGNNGRGAEVMLYSSWTFWQHSGKPPEYDQEAHIPFRERLEIDGARWERMQDIANANRPDGMPPVYMIPGHRLMMRIYDDISSGAAPGLTSIGTLFSDDIHLSALGQYAITCLAYAVIYHRNPSELPDRLAIPEDNFSKDQARYLKAVAWEVANEYRRAGLPSP